MHIKGLVSDSLGLNTDRESRNPDWEEAQRRK